MYETACVVNLRYRGNQGTCCGIVLDASRGLVLAHGSCLGPFVQEGQFDLDTVTLTTCNDLESLGCDVLLRRVEAENACDLNAETRLSQVEVNTQADARVVNIATVPENEIIPDGAPSSQQLTKQIDSDVTGMVDQKEFVHQPKRHSNRSGGMLEELSRQKEFYAYSKFSARVTDFFQCQVVAESLATLLPESSWELGERKEANGKSDASGKNSNGKDSKLTAKREHDLLRLLSSFIVLQVKDWVPYAASLVVRTTRECRVGDRVEICSTPFGGLKPDAFINSYSRGIVSNVAGTDNCLVLSDARCILGGEGSPLYTFQRGVKPTRCLTGIVLASLSWKNDEWVGFCVACDVGAVLGSLPPHLTPLHRSLRQSPVAASLSSPKSAVQQGVASPEVVLLQVGSTWGSGVVVHRARGLVLTCSHVVKDAHRHPVRAKRTRGGEEEKVDIVYRQHPLQRQFDLALVRRGSAQRSSGGSHLTVDIATPVEGMEVYVIGHALFGSEHDLQPSVTSGVISKVSSVSGIPVMIQTTCAVHPGASGGALVDTRGRLLGIVVCNARDNTTGASFPHINMSVPVCTVWPVIQEFVKTGDAGCLKALAVDSTVLDNIWSLGAAHNTDVMKAVMISKL